MTPAIINMVAAVLVAGLVFGALNRMDRHTIHAIRGAILMVFIAMLGQVFAPVMRQWDNGWTDTLLYGAVAAFVVASRRLPSGLPPRHATVCAFVIMGATMVLVLWVGNL
jgi:hypothetical protein